VGDPDIKLKSPTLAIVSDDVPEFTKTKHLFDHTIMVSPSMTLEKLAAKITEATDQFLKEKLKKNKWENVIINCHGNPGTLLMCGGVTRMNLHVLAKPLHLMTNDIWMYSCQVAANADRDRFRRLTMIERYFSKKTLADYVDVTKNSASELLVNFAEDQKLTKTATIDKKLYDVLEQYRKGSAKQFLYYLRSLKKEYKNWHGEHKKYTAQLLIEDLLSSLTALDQHAIPIGFCSLLAQSTKANVWASPHWQIPTRKAWIRNTLDPFEGDLYKFMPNGTARLVNTNHFAIPY
jgi:hypothetical protein